MSRMPAHNKKPRGSTESSGSFLTPTRIGVGLVGVLLCVGGGILWNSESPWHVLDGDDPKIDDDLELGLMRYGMDTDDKAIKAFDSYVERYGCATDNVSFGLDNNLGVGLEETTRDTNGARINFNLNPYDEKTGQYGQLDQKTIVDTMMHAATHACSTTDIFDLSDNGIEDIIIQIGGGENARIYGSQGLALVVEGTDDKFTLIEEGVAEWLAKQNDPNYDVTDAYASLYHLTERLVLRAGITPGEVAKMTQSPDGVLQFAKGVYSERPETTNYNDRDFIVALMNSYTKTSQGQ